MLSPDVPLPVRQGVHYRVLQHLHALAQHGPVAVYALSGRAPSKPSVGVAQWHVTADPEPGRGRAGAAALEWMRTPDGSPLDQFRSPTVGDELHRLLTDYRPDLVVVEDLAFAPHVDAITASSAKIVVDLHNVLPDLQRQLSRAETTHRGRALVFRELGRRVARDLDHTLACADAVWIPSAVDAERLSRSPDVTVRVPVHVVPNTVDVDHYRFVPGPRPGRGLVYPGLFRFPPNERAARVLATDVLDGLPGHRLELVGADPTRDVVALARNPRVTVTGPVPDVRPYLESAEAMPVPLTEGSGTRLKILEGFAAGCPVVSTAVGAEGIDAEPDVHLLRAETADEFVDAIRTLDHDADLARQLSLAARELVETRYSWTSAAAAVAAALPS